jgi:hypothetical protein
MISSSKSADGSCGAYIGAAGERQAIRQNTPNDARSRSISGITTISQT